MRHLTWLTLIAFAVACNKEETDTDSDTNDSDTTPSVTLSLDSGTTSYAVKIDGTTVCSSTYSITGEELETDFCADCDFMFSVDATETANTDTANCPDRNPWRYTLSVPYPAAYPDDRAGIAYASERWYYPGYLDVPVDGLFFTFYHYNGTVYSYSLLAGTLYPGTADEVAIPGGTFTNNSGAISWNYGPDAFNTASGAFIRNCTDKTDINAGNYLGAQATVAAANSGDVILGTDTVDTKTGSVNCEGATADSYTFTLTAAGDVKLTLNTPTTAKPMDGYMYVNNSAGCTVAVADDQFACTAGKCTDGDTDTSNDYDCCPSVKLTAAPAGEYTVYVQAHPTGGGSCTDTGKVADYELKSVGATGIAAAGNELSPSYELDVSGTGTVTETEN